MVAVSLKKSFFQAEDGIRDVIESRGLGDVYKRQGIESKQVNITSSLFKVTITTVRSLVSIKSVSYTHLTLPTMMSV